MSDSTLRTNLIRLAHKGTPELRAELLPLLAVSHTAAFATDKDMVGITAHALEDQVKRWARAEQAIAATGDPRFQPKSPYGDPAAVRQHMEAAIKEALLIEQTLTNSYAPFDLKPIIEQIEIFLTDNVRLVDTVTPQTLPNGDINLWVKYVSRPTRLAPREWVKKLEVKYNSWLKQMAKKFGLVQMNKGDQKFPLQLPDGRRLHIDYEV